MSVLLRFADPASPISLAVYTTRILSSSSSRFLSTTTPTRMSVTEQSIREMFKPLEEGRGQEFFAKSVDPQVDWTVTGSQNPLGGHYTSAQDFAAATFTRLSKVLKTPLVLKVTNVIASGNQASVELQADSICHNGLPFDNCYAWNITVKEGKIVQVRAYLDSALVKMALEQNE